MSNVVLITGVSRFLGSGLAAQLAADPSVDRVIGVDTMPPRHQDLPRLGRTEFVRADIRNPLIAKVISQARVDTVVHSAVGSAPRGVAARAPIKEMNVLGTMQLLAACQRSETVSRVVVKSTTAVYGASAADPAVFTEDMDAVGPVPAGTASDAVEIESYVRGFGRRRPDVAVTILRFANILGPSIDSALTRYLAMPIMPTALGFDPRLQFLHESDAIETLRLATVSSRPGIVNVAGDGVLLLSQVIRRAGRLRAPVPAAAIGLAGGLVRNSGVIEFSAGQARFLNYGRVVDTRRLRAQFGYSPRYSTADALWSYVAKHPPLPRFGLAGLAALAGVGRRAGLAWQPVPATEEQ